MGGVGHGGAAGADAAHSYSVFVRGTYAARGAVWGRGAVLGACLCRCLHALAMHETQPVVTSHFFNRLRT